MSLRARDRKGLVSAQGTYQHINILSMPRTNSIVSISPCNQLLATLHTPKRCPVSGVWCLVLAIRRLLLEVPCVLSLCMSLTSTISCRIDWIGA